MSQKYQKIINVIIVVAALVLLVATAAVAASGDGDIWGKLGSVQNALQIASAAIIGFGLYKKLPGWGQKAINVALSIPPDFSKTVESQLGTPDARGKTIEQLAIREAQRREMRITPEQIHTLVVALAPMARKIKLRIP